MKPTYKCCDLHSFTRYNSLSRIRERKCIQKSFMNFVPNIPDTDIETTDFQFIKIK